MNKRIQSLKSHPALIAVLAVVLIVALGVGINNRNTAKLKAEFTNAETKINKLGDDILLDSASTRHQKRSFCYYTNTIYKNDGVCDVKYDILFENTTEAQAIQIFEKAATKARGMYKVTISDFRRIDAIKSAELSEAYTTTLEYLGSGKIPPLYCDMKINHRGDVDPAYIDQRPGTKIPKNSSLLTIECYGKTKANFYPRVEVVSFSN